MRIELLQSARSAMTSKLSPHPRYRLYTTRGDYRSALFDTEHAADNFEREVCRRFNVAAAVCVPMARVGLYLVLREVIRPGQKVILSPLTIVDVVNAVLIERIREHVRKFRQLSKWRLLIRMLAGSAVDAATHPPVFARFTYPLVRRNYGIINRQLDPEHHATRWSRIPECHLRRMRNSQAQIGLGKLDRVDLDAMCRIEHAQLYHEGFEQVDGIITPQRRTDLSHIYAYFPIQIHDRDGLLRYSQIRRRDFAAQHLRNCAELPMFSDFHRDCPNARAAARELVLLPTYPRYPVSEIKKNIEVISEFARRPFDGRPKETAGRVSRV